MVIIIPTNVMIPNTKSDVLVVLESLSDVTLAMNVFVIVTLLCTQYRKKIKEDGWYDNLDRCTRI